jgi:hypothetical protein
MIRQPHEGWPTRVPLKRARDLEQMGRVPGRSSPAALGKLPGGGDLLLAAGKLGHRKSTDPLELP